MGRHKMSDRESIETHPQGEYQDSIVPNCGAYR